MTDYGEKRAPVPDATDKFSASISLSHLKRLKPSAGQCIFVTANFVVFNTVASWFFKCI